MQECAPSKEHPASRIVVVSGPTASGKSGLALDLAERLNGTIVNADALQLYQDLKILSVRPEAEDEVRAPHRLYGVLDGAEAASAARWRAEALREIRAAQSRGRLPILVGGTGLYIRALLSGLSPLPPVPEAVRAAARALHAEIGDGAFHARLAARDPIMAARLAPDDGQRMIRAWEVLEATGLSLAEWQTLPPEPASVDAVTLVLDAPRDWLAPRIDRRVWQMVEAGALEEVAALVARRLDPALPVMKAVGVPEFARHLAGELSLEEAVTAAQAATRRYAKRQRTWLRQQTPRDAKRLHRLDAQESKRLSDSSFTIIRDFLLTV